MPGIMESILFRGKDYKHGNSRFLALSPLPGFLVTRDIRSRDVQTRAAGLICACGSNVSRNSKESWEKMLLSISLTIYRKS